MALSLMLMKYIQVYLFKKTDKSILIDIKKNILQVRSRIKEASLKSARNKNKITLLAVSKKKTVEEIEKAYNLGIENFGENYCQEAVMKINNLRNKNIKWHFIGKIQSNKTKDISKYFDWVHTIDRIKVANRLDSFRPKNKKPLNVCIQINQSLESHKAGVSESDALELANQLLDLPNIRLRGLMIIPPKAGNLKIHFSELKSLQDKFNKNGIPIDTLSMGMSSDFEQAIEEGSTIVRIGTSIFGERK